MARFLACLIALFFFLPGLAAATVLVDLQSSEGELSARLLISGDTLLTGDQGQPQLTAADQLIGTLTVTAPEEMRITLPSVNGPGFGDFTLLDQGEVTIKRIGQSLVHERQWFFEPYNPGPYQLPELLIRARSGDMTTELILPRPELVAQGMPADGANLDDILPPQAPAGFVPRYLGWAAGLVVLLALASWLWWHRKQKGPKPLPPKEQALAELETLSALPPRAQVERLAFILRSYLASRFDLPCLEQTYDEYGPALAACEDVPPESRAIFLALLKRCDLIKFSNIEPEPTEAEAITAQMREGLAACPLAKTDDKTCGRW